MVLIAAFTAALGWALALLFLLLFWRSWRMVGVWRTRAETAHGALKSCKEQLRELERLYEEARTTPEEWPGEVTLVQSLYDLLKER